VYCEGCSTKLYQTKPKYRCVECDSLYVCEPCYHDHLQIHSRPFHRFEHAFELVTTKLLIKSMENDKDNIPLNVGTNSKVRIRKKEKKFFFFFFYFFFF
jgi:hypothetical protein